MVAHHNLTVANKSRAGKLFFQSVSDHVVRTEGDKLDDTSKGKFTDVVSANVDVSGLFTVDWICVHGHNRQIVFMEVGRAFWGDAEILKDRTDVHELFATWRPCIQLPKSATESCRRGFQLMGPPLNMRTKPV